MNHHDDGHTPAETSGSPAETTDVERWATELSELRTRARRAIAELSAINERQEELKEKIRAHRERR